ncbi:hypothetical protein C1H46_045521 [Malus baccata]|uniref:Uncharacterized protein n=1 Tax=Malus baccata TaxID=106549 RepID=A0A540K3Y9_MALBA|nr:hypothetical protein C1H46_045521 [Malus baccata]
MCKNFEAHRSKCNSVTEHKFMFSTSFFVCLQFYILYVLSNVQENGHSSEYTWILSTGWWEGRAPVNPDAVVVVGILCIILIGGFVYINRVRPHRSITKQSIQSAILIAIVALLYSLWCASQIFWVNPRRPAVGEEADYGVLVFLAKYFFLPHLLCILSMHPRDLEAEQIPP